MERNTLMAQCYPKLKDYCREKHGLEFQVGFHLIKKKIVWHIEISQIDIYIYIYIVIDIYIYIVKHELYILDREIDFHGARY